jgi:membrane-bound serine protease (ClpP class)
VFSVALGTGAFFAFAVSRALLTMKKRPSTGREAFAGKKAIVKANLEPDGMVLMDGELWKARSEEGEIRIGETVEVIVMEGFTVIVRKI